MKRYTCLFLLTALLCPISAFTNALAGDPYKAERDRMVRKQIVARGITDPKVIRAMKNVKRHMFVPDENASHAYMGQPPAHRLWSDHITALYSGLYDRNTEPEAR